MATQLSSMWIMWVIYGVVVVVHLEVPFCCCHPLVDGSVGAGVAACLCGTSLGCVGPQSPMMSVSCRSSVSVVEAWTSAVVQAHGRSVVARGRADGTAGAVAAPGVGMDQPG